MKPFEFFNKLWRLQVFHLVEQNTDERTLWRAKAQWKLTEYCTAVLASGFGTS